MSSAPTIYFTPFVNDVVSIYDGTSFIPQQFAELALALDPDAGHAGYHQIGKSFFLGVFLSGGALKLGSGVAWESNSATGIGAGTCEAEIYQGRLVNKFAMIVRFGSGSADTVSVPARQFTIVGGFRANANGVTSDDATMRFLSNLYNVVPRAMRAIDGSSTPYIYSAAAFRPVNNDTAGNIIYWFHCAPGRLVTVNAQHHVSNSAAGASPSNGIGLDSVSAKVSGSLFVVQTTAGPGVITAPVAKYRGYPGQGLHYATHLETGDGTGTTTWYPAGTICQIEGETLN